MAMIVKSYLYFWSLMISTLKIKANILLAIMLFTLLHDLVPHVHHQHNHQLDKQIEANAHAHGDHHHHDHGDHHHPAEDDLQEKQQSLLDFLFNDHTHARHSHQEEPAIVERTKSPKPVEHSSIIPFYNLTSLIWEIPLDAKQEFDLVVDVGKKDPLLLHKPLRGPPYLG